MNFQIWEVIYDIHAENSKGTTTPPMIKLVFSDVLDMVTKEANNLVGLLSSLHTQQ
jgi:hypothetical protein